MTKITYYPTEHRMEIKGHAGFAMAGQDIVCAAVSILTMALENMVCDHAEALSPLLYSNKGECSVKCTPSKGNKQKCVTIFETIFGGFELLSMHYPEYVKSIKIKEE